MKKIIITMIMVLGLLLPISTFASPNPDDYETMNLLEVINTENNAFSDAEGYTVVNPTITEVNDTEDQVPIYVFFGLGCPHCHDLFTYLNEIAPEYDSKFRLVAFEIWYDEANKGLVGELQDFLGSDVIEGTVAKGYGVPIIIIGENVYQGFGEENEETVKEAIDTVAKQDPNSRYDIFTEMKKAEEEALKKEKAANVAIIVWDGVFVAIATAIILGFIYYQNNKIHDRFDAIYEKLGLEIEEPKAKLVTVTKEVEDDTFEEIVDPDDYELKEEKPTPVKKTNKSSSKSKSKNKSKK